MADDLLAMSAALPWWASVGLGAASYLVLHAIAGQDVGTATSTREIGDLAVRGLFRTLAAFGQYILPLIFFTGALVGALGKRKRVKLVETVAAGKTPATLGQMSWREFEALVEEAFHLRGYAVKRRGGDGPDGGVDLVLNRGAEKVLVQCKHWRAQKVSVSVMRELYGVMAAEGAAAGIVVTSGSFTVDAIEFAEGRNVRLIAGAELFEMIRGVHSAKPSSKTIVPTESAATNASTSGCPVCGSPMVRRVARRGAHAGSAFYGCSRYPACRGIVEIE